MVDSVFQRYDCCHGRTVAAAMTDAILGFRAYRRNASELLDLLQAFESAFPNELLTRPRRRELILYSADVIRRFQNTAASSQSFLDHAKRSVCRRYRPGDAFRAEFLAEHGRVTHLPVCEFVTALRGHQLHARSVGPVFSRSLMGFGDNPRAVAEILISISGLREEARASWKRLGLPRAIEYLDKLDSSLNLTTLFEEYDPLIFAFFQWWQRGEREVNATALNEAKELLNAVASVSEEAGSYLQAMWPDNLLAIA